MQTRLKKRRAFRWRTGLPNAQAVRHRRALQNKVYDVATGKWFSLSAWLTAIDRAADQALAKIHLRRVLAQIHQSHGHV